MKELPLFDCAGPFTSTGGECCHHVALDLSIVDIAGPSQNDGVEPHELHEAHCGALLTTRTFRLSIQYSGPGNFDVVGRWKTKETIVTNVTVFEIGLVSLVWEFFSPEQT